MLVKLRTIYQQPDGSFAHPDSIVEVDAKTGKDLIDGKFATLHTPAPRAAPAPAPKTESKSEGDEKSDGKADGKSEGDEKSESHGKGGKGGKAEGHKRITDL